MGCIKWQAKQELECGAFIYRTTHDIQYIHRLRRTLFHYHGACLGLPQLQCNIRAYRIYWDLVLRPLQHVLTSWLIHSRGQSLPVFIMMQMQSVCRTSEHITYNMRNEHAPVISHVVQQFLDPTLPLWSSHLVQSLSSLFWLFCSSILHVCHGYNEAGRADHGVA